MCNKPEKGCCTSRQASGVIVRWSSLTFPLSKMSNKCSVFQPGCVRQLQGGGGRGAGNGVTDGVEIKTARCKMMAGNRQIVGGKVV